MVYAMALHAGVMVTRDPSSRCCQYWHIVCTRIEALIFIPRIWELYSRVPLSLRAYYGVRDVWQGYLYHEFRTYGIGIGAEENPWGLWFKLGLRILVLWWHLLRFLGAATPGILWVQYVNIAPCILWVPRLSMYEFGKCGIGLGPSASQRVDGLRWGFVCCCLGGT
jgi:hypothetical protein